MTAEMLDLYKLNQFVVLARTGSYVRATAALHLSQSALTRNIQALERHFGVVLLDRERGRAGIELTDAGRIVLRRAHEILARVHETHDEVGGVRSCPSKKVVFGLGPMLAGSLLAEELPTYVDGDRLMGVEIITESPEEMLAMLQCGEIEFYLGLQAGPRKTSSLVRQELVGSASPRLWVRPGHPLLGQGPVPLTAIGSYTVLSGRAWNEIALAAVEDDLTRHLLTASVQINNYQLLVDIIEDTSGILVSTVADRYGRLEQLEIQGGLAVPESQLYAFTSASAGLSTPAAGTRDLLVASYRWISSKGTPGEADAFAHLVRIRRRNERMDVPSRTVADDVAPLLEVAT